MLDIGTLSWEKMNFLMPAIVQDAFDGRVLMQGYMNRDALERTLQTGKVTFWSRSRKELWTKGETSGNYLELVQVVADCDNDSLLVTARPHGPVCHLETPTCFDCEGKEEPALQFLAQLDRVIAQRHADRPPGSYTTELFDSGPKRIAQKVGEEAVETALAAAAGDNQELLNEAADLVYHLLVLLRSRDAKLDELLRVLRERHA
ncbi:MAG: bifunctional phosphoribosyl-AMP cyclohydrolase/phosphoribosyl-ATP diphosphatase HisIE [Xanthomonadales bacterium]|nr:bifunctional phosphoribosyl-AMP cyclohydrolase/phosphoribosyl-ATP diphosphatase HisIE [Xanthomonadales bacterium]